jgi:hypothetical protein
MGLNQASFYGDSYGTPAASWNIGPYNLGSCTKLLRVRCGLTIAPGEGTLTAGQIAIDAFIWGVQWVPHGNSPLSLPADAFEANFLWAETVHTDWAFTALWAPATDTAAAFGAETVGKDWRAQLPIGQDIDLYVSATSTISVGNTQGSMMMRVLNTT